ncbi:hypothetical protein BKA69DRAFT_196253 [Paraphysoderma sedebokerense]|nr:hypothetical protein BKA69DRAFT_196253 [Paraphysoderma sedebokerense]
MKFESVERIINRREYFNRAQVGYEFNTGIIEKYHIIVTSSIYIIIAVFMVHHYKVASTVAAISASIFGSFDQCDHPNRRVEHYLSNPEAGGLYQFAVVTPPIFIFLPITKKTITIICRVSHLHFPLFFDFRWTKCNELS